MKKLLVKCSYSSQPKKQARLYKLARAELGPQYTYQDVCLSVSVNVILEKTLGAKNPLFSASYFWTRHFWASVGSVKLTSKELYRGKPALSFGIFAVEKISFLEA